MSKNDEDRGKQTGTEELPYDIGHEAVLKLTTSDERVKKPRGRAYFRLIFLSLFGLFTFFVSFPVFFPEFLTPLFPSDGWTSTILIDHVANVVKTLLGKNLVDWLIIVVMIAGAIQPFYNKTWKTSPTDIFFTTFKILGVPLGICYVLSQHYGIQIGPDAIYHKSMMPFLFDKLAANLTFLIPIGSAFIIFLTDYGLMEYIGVYARPIMRPLYKSPGRSAIDAVASFVGSYSIGLLITGKQYAKGYYSKREAVIIATGFSTVSATFVVIVAKTLGLMEHWNMFFWSSFFVTFAVTAINVRMWPITRIADSFHPDTEQRPPEAIIRTGLTKKATEEGFAAADMAPPVPINMFKNLLIGIRVTVGLIPSIMSVGLLGLLLYKYTPVFDVLGYLLYPVTLLLQFPDPHLVAKAASTGIAEMFLPAMIVSDQDLLTRFVIGIVCISEILFFSASIPCMVAMKIPVTMKELVIIWYERTFLTLLIATPLAMLLFKLFDLS